MSSFSSMTDSELTVYKGVMKNFLISENQRKKHLYLFEEFNDLSQLSSMSEFLDILEKVKELSHKLEKESNKIIKDFEEEEIKRESGSSDSDKSIPSPTPSKPRESYRNTKSKRIQYDPKTIITFDNKKYRKIATPPDGNCGYYAILAGNNPDEYVKNNKIVLNDRLKKQTLGLREIVANSVNEDNLMLAVAMGPEEDDTPYKSERQYKNHVKQSPGKWIGDIELAVASETHGPIHIHIKGQDFVNKKETEYNKNDPPIHLILENGNTEGAHYSLLLPLEHSAGQKRKLRYKLK